MNSSRKSATTKDGTPTEHLNLVNMSVGAKLEVKLGAIRKFVIAE